MAGSSLRVFKGLAYFILFTIGTSTALSAHAASTCVSGIEQPESARSSPQYNYFRQVLAKGESATLQELLRFWSPEMHNNFSPSSRLLACQEKPWGGLRTNAVGDIPPDCRPDVLYSWGTAQKLDTVSQTLMEGARWTGSPNPGGHSGVYATLSPAATFNYGPIAIRFKLKNGVAFRNIDQDVPPSMVMYQGRNMNDFLIGDARVVASWSYGTAEHYDELVEDVLRISNNANNAGQGYALRPPVGSGYARLFSVMVPERSMGNEANLKKVLLQMLSMVVNDQGRIIYQKGSCANAQDHFAKRY